MLLESEMAVAHESLLDVGTRLRPVAVERRTWARDSVWARPVADVLALGGAAFVVGGLRPAVLVYAALVLASLVADWHRPVPIAAGAAEDFRKIAVRAGLPAIAVLALDGGIPWAAVAGATALAVGSARALSYAILRWARRSGRVVEPVLLLGSGDQVLALRERIWSHPDLGLRPVLGSSLSLRGESSVFLSADEIAHWVRRDHIRRVVVAGGSGYDAELVSTVRSVAAPFELFYLPGEQHPNLGLRAGDEVLAGYPVQRLSTGSNSLAARLSKRAVDLLGASILVILLLPLLTAIAIGVKLTSRGPVLFRQSRVGRNGAHFDMLKFRSFPTDHKDVALALPLDECPLPLGRFLRRTSLDELPQLLNVLRGEMSLVGPRPERPHFAEPLAEKIPEYDARHRVAGGLTGLAQVHGYWGLSEIEARVRLDNHYIDTWSFWGDLGIMLRTVPTVIAKSLS